MFHVTKRNLGNCSSLFVSMPIANYIDLTAKASMFKWFVMGNLRVFPKNFGRRKSKERLMIVSKWNNLGRQKTRFWVSAQTRKLRFKTQSWRARRDSNAGPSA
jgi:hypothetical protein